MQGGGQVGLLSTKTCLRARRWSQTRASRARVFFDVENEDPLLDAHGVGPGALQEGDADDRAAHPPLLDDGGHDRPGGTKGGTCFFSGTWGELGIKWASCGILCQSKT